MRSRRTCVWMMTVLAALGILVGISNPATAAKKNSYKVSKTTITVTAAQNSDITECLRGALDKAHELDQKKGKGKKIYTVKLPKNGKFKLTDNLHIYSNTTLDMNNSTLTWEGKTSRNMLMTGIISYNKSKACTGYKGFKNITVKNGSWISSSKNESTILRLFHATNVKLQNLVIKGGACEHQVEVAAIDGFTVEKVTFCDRAKSKRASMNEEALQLDIPCNSTVFKSIVEDGAVMKNVTITGCTFRNVPRGVGTHAMLVGAYHENITITNNTFENIEKEAIVALNYYNCTITGNKIKNCGTGILVQNGKPSLDAVYTTIKDGKAKYSGKILYDLKTVISKNTINIVTKKAADEIVGIKVQGYSYKGSEKGADGKKVPKNNMYISGVTIKNNTITSEGFGIHLSDARTITVADNTITGKGKKKDYDGIFLSAACKKVAVTGNTVKNALRHGIFAQESSTFTKITSNTVTTTNGNGIGLFNKSQVTGDITDNKVSGTKSHGIFISTDSSVKSINKNTVKNAGVYGICLFNKSTASGDITGNKVTGAKKFAIFLNENSTARNINKNKIDKSGDQGISLVKSQVTDSIKSNTVTNTKKNAIFLTQNSSAVSISGNTVKTAGAIGIGLFTNSQVTGGIENNTVTDVTGNAISVSTKSKAGTIAKNTVSNPKGYGIYVFKNSHVTGDVKDNTISGCGKNGIMLYTTASVKNISGNRIENTQGSYGISICDNSTVKKSIKDNTVKNSTKSKSGIALGPKGTVQGDVSGNTIEKAKEYGIYLYDSSAIEGAIVDNTISQTKLYAVQVKEKCSVSAIGYNELKANTQNLYSVYAASKTAQRVGNLNAVNGLEWKTGSDSAVVSWKKLDDAESYEVCYSPKQDFSSKVTTISVTKQTATLEELGANKTGYVRVRGCRKVNGVMLYGPYSDAISVSAE